MRILIPTIGSGNTTIDVEPGCPTVILGPNGSGKSRLGIFIEDLESIGVTHRIAAQRSLELPEEVFSESYDQAIGTLRRDKISKRRKPASPSAMEYAYDQMLSALFAEQHRALESAHDRSAGRSHSERPTTCLDKLQNLWKELMPHRHLIFSERTIKATTDYNAEPFEGSQLSDGERLVVYMLGQALLLENGSLLIVDEPELHMNRALLVRLWDAIEQNRSDCSFIYITHDVDFAASRGNARLYAVMDYKPPVFREVLVRTRTRVEMEAPPAWTIEPLSFELDVPNEVLVRIVGSRKPILFVEGHPGGLDHQIYKAAYSDFTVIPVGPCSQVLHLVRSFRKQASLHWLHCAGIVDGDFRVAGIDGRIEKGVWALPVCEIENFLLTPTVFAALARASSIPEDLLDERIDRLKANVIEIARKQSERMALEKAMARIWSETNRPVGIKPKGIADLARNYRDRVMKVDPASILSECTIECSSLLNAGDYNEILRVYNDKGGLLKLLAKELGIPGRTNRIRAHLYPLLTRTNVITAMRQILPVLSADSMSCDAEDGDIPATL